MHLFLGTHSVHVLQQSIKEGKEWFMAHLQHAPGLAAKMAIRQSQLPSYDQQIHVIYLANDVLLKRWDLLRAYQRSSRESGSSETS